MSNLSLEKQIEIIETQISNFDDLTSKLAYINDFFKADPEFSMEAIETVLSNLCREYKNE